MITSDMIRKHNSLTGLCRCIRQTPQNFNNNLRRETVSFEEMIRNVEVLSVEYEQVFVFSNGEKIQNDNMGSEPIKLNTDEM
ncbi:MAG: XRE family transcriptional regulator [Eubacterium sp.]|nr:XRE family transcriptional regulator [Eubacterium sp.]